MKKSSRLRGWVSAAQYNLLNCFRCYSCQNISVNKMKAQEYRKIYNLTIWPYWVNQRVQGFTAVFQDVHSQSLNHLSIFEGSIKHVCKWRMSSHFQSQYTCTYMYWRCVKRYSRAVLEIWVKCDLGPLRWLITLFVRLCHNISL